MGYKTSRTSSFLPSQNRFKVVNYLTQLYLWLILCLPQSLTFSLSTPLADNLVLLQTHRHFAPAMLKLKHLANASFCLLRSKACRGIISLLRSVLLRPRMPSELCYRLTATQNTTTTDLNFGLVFIFILHPSPLHRLSLSSPFAFFCAHAHVCAHLSVCLCVLYARDVMFILLCLSFYVHTLCVRRSCKHCVVL